VTTINPKTNKTVYTDEVHYVEGAPTGAYAIRTSPLKFDNKGKI